MGLAPERDNFYVACGFTSGIAASGGAGKAMAEWIVEGEPGLDLWAFDVRRFGSHHMSAQIPRRAQRRQLLALLPDPLSDRGTVERARRPALAALSAAAGEERRVRLALRLGAAELVRAGRHRGGRQAVVRGPAQLVRPGRRRMPGRARARRADRPEFLLQVRDLRARRVRRPAAARRQRPRQAGRRAGLHPALQRARRHRGRPHLRPSRREPLLHGDRQRLRRARHRLDQEAPAGRRLGHAARAHLGPRHDQPRRARCRAGSSRRSPTATSATRPSPT